MILDTLDNSSFYEGMHPSFPLAFEWLRKFDPAAPDGRYAIEGTNAVAIMQRYQTAPAIDKKWEAHRVHGDIQVIYSGVEQIGFAQRELLTVRTPYNAEKDAEFYEPLALLSSLLTLREGSFAIFLPQDAHQPGVMIEAPAPIVKVVVKFRL